jgi:hypothetical protein
MKAVMEVLADPVLFNAAMEAAVDPAQMKAAMEIMADPVLVKAVMEAAADPAQMKAAMEAAAANPARMKAMMEAAPDPVRMKAVMEAAADPVRMKAAWALMAVPVFMKDVAKSAYMKAAMEVAADPVHWEAGMEKMANPAITAGSLVQMLGLNAAHLNGSFGRVMEWVESKERWQVQLVGVSIKGQGVCVISVKPNNVRAVTSVEAAALKTATAEAVNTVPGKKFSLHELAKSKTMTSAKAVQQARDALKRCPSAATELEDVTKYLPLHYAASTASASSVALAKLFLTEHPEGAKAVTVVGKLPIHLCSYCTSTSSTTATVVDLAEQLLRAYPEGLRSADRLGLTPLHLACKSIDGKNKHVKLALVKYLVRVGGTSIIDIQDTAGVTPFVAIQEKGFAGQEVLRFFESCRYYRGLFKWDSAEEPSQGGSSYVRIAILARDLTRNDAKYASDWSKFKRGTKIALKFMASKMDRDHEVDLHRQLRGEYIIELLDDFDDESPESTDIVQGRWVIQMVDVLFFVMPYSPCIRY